MRVLLIQVRRSDDPMSEHERKCIAKKVTTSVEWVFRNAVGTSASETWLTGIDAVIVGGSGDFSVHDPRSRVWLDPLLQLIGATIRNDILFFGILLRVSVQ